VIAQLLLAVLVTLMFGLVVSTRKTLVLALSGYTAAPIEVLRRFGQKPMLTGLTIVAAFFAATICLWALVTGTPTVLYMATAIGSSSFAVSLLVSRYHNYAVGHSPKHIRAKARKLFAALLSGWTHVSTTISGSLRSISVSRDNRRYSLHSGRFSVVQASMSAVVFVLSSFALLAGCIMATTGSALAGDAGLATSDNGGSPVVFVVTIILVGAALVGFVAGRRIRA
jgi:hypothetical protein